MTNGEMVDEKRERVYTGGAETKRLAGRPFLFPADHQPNSLAQKRRVLSCGGAGYAVHSFRSQQPNSKVEPGVFSFLEVEAMEGYVYLVESSVGFYKIGKSKDPVKRIRRFEVTLPFNVTLLKLIKVSDMTYYEQILHSMFKEHRQGGEWFLLDYQSLDMIMRFESQQDIDDIAWIADLDLDDGTHDPFRRFGNARALQDYINKDLVHLIN